MADRGRSGGAEGGAPVVDSGLVAELARDLDQFRAHVHSGVLVSHLMKLGAWSLAG